MNIILRDGGNTTFLIFIDDLYEIRIILECLSRWSTYLYDYTRDLKVTNNLYFYIFSIESTT